ncbi:hypothetical protein B0J11DRAFT_502262 [Dendryphion nanum]|uniref:Uncharacterized protein n=1 Tax=Dendryphion nanum TaxID=256645 RepID=A0A9P9EDE9_9PLEO|nr:hypothetical protein B0J11DRAFT_502262 [Dendryphion nanum]
MKSIFALAILPTIALSHVIPPNVGPHISPHRVSIPIIIDNIHYDKRAINTGDGPVIQYPPAVTPIPVVKTTQPNNSGADGEKRCSTFTATSGHQIGPCPDKEPSPDYQPQDYRKKLGAQFCGNRPCHRKHP